MTYEFDVFLSYHWRDQKEVLELAKKLREQDLKVFLDRWYLVPGQPWPQKLEQVLATCGAVAVCAGPGEMGPWQQREMNFALERQGKETGFPVIPILLSGSDPALGFLGLNTWVDFREGIEQPMALAILEAAIRRQPPGPDLQERMRETRTSINPYKGLAYFREEDAKFFFGRDEYVNKLHEKLQRCNFVAVVGASGSGKSSIVRAGLVPKLRQDTESPWEILTMVPGDRPLYNLAAGFLPLLEPDMSVSDRLIKVGEHDQALQNGSLKIRDYVEDILLQQPGTERFLLVVDQWEELYTLNNKQDLARNIGQTATDQTKHISGLFIDGLLDAAEAGILSVVITMRGDFVGHAVGYRRMADCLQDAQVNIGPMSRDELKGAIEEPAGKLGVGFESGLVKLLLDAVREEPGNLPLLEFVLQRLWNDPERHGGDLRHQFYQDMNGLEGALTQTADEIYRHLSKNNQQLVHKIFVQLVRPGDGVEDTRRRAVISDFGVDAAAVIKHLADERLLVTGQQAAQQTVEVSHEALIRHWSQFRDWINQDREFLLWRERLRYACKEDMLLETQRLSDARRWLQSRGEELTDDETGFIRRSVNQSRLRIVRNLAVTILPLLILGSAWGGFYLWHREHDLTPRSGFFVLLARFGIYTLQPEMVQIPPADVWRDEANRTFMMGSDDYESEKPRHPVTIPKPFKIGKYEVTFDEYQVFAHLVEEDGGCKGGHQIKAPSDQDEGWGRGRRPVINVSWEDAVCYAEWLNHHIGWLNDSTDKKFHLPTEAEWEYAARAGTKTDYWWGDDMKKQKAVCDRCDSEWEGREKGKQTAEVDDAAFKPNPWGLYHTSGNVLEWVQDCWHDNYLYAPEKGDVSREDQKGGDCGRRVLRGGSWNDTPWASVRPSATGTTRTTGSAALDFVSPRTNFLYALILFPLYFRLFN